MSDTHIISAFIRERVGVAVALKEGNCGGSIKDAFLLLSSAISAIAAEIWPGDAIDRRRIVETLVTYSSTVPSPKTISIPLLYQSLASKPIQARLVRSHFLKFAPCRILVDREVDRAEEEILAVVPSLSSKTVRYFSYANLFYTELRSGLVHEYQTSKRGFLMPFSKQNAAVSYMNQNSVRKIVFHFDWLVDSFRSVAESVDPLFDSLPRATPTSWWVDGK